ncbi:hypothetical protein V8E36_001570 [Tilletia maclaganii]
MKSKSTPSSSTSDNNAVQPSGAPRTPRPSNSWMLYRAYKAKELADFRASQGLGGPASLPEHLRPGKGALTKIVADLWRNETAEVREHFHQLAEQEKMDHKQKYPGYRYRPRRRGTSGRHGGDSSSSSNSSGGGGVGGSHGDDTSSQGSSMASSYTRRDSSDARSASSEHGSGLAAPAGALLGPVILVPQRRAVIHGLSTAFSASGPSSPGALSNPDSSQHSPPAHSIETAPAVMIHSQPAIRPASGMVTGVWEPAHPIP